MRMQLQLWQPANRKAVSSLYKDVPLELISFELQPLRKKDMCYCTFLSNFLEAKSEHDQAGTSPYCQWEGTLLTSTGLYVNSVNLFSGHNLAMPWAQPFFITGINIRLPYLRWNHDFNWLLQTSKDFYRLLKTSTVDTHTLSKLHKSIGNGNSDFEIGYFAVKEEGLY